MERNLLVPDTDLKIRKNKRLMMDRNTTHSIVSAQQAVIGIELISSTARGYPIHRESMIEFNALGIIPDGGPDLRNFLGNSKREDSSRI